MKDEFYEMHFFKESQRKISSFFKEKHFGVKVNHINASFSDFIQKNPLLIYAIFASFGVIYALKFNWIFASPVVTFSLLVYFFRKPLYKKVWLLSLIFLIGFYLITSFFILTPKFLKEKGEIKGIGYVSFSSVKPSLSYGKSWVYEGKLIAFYDKQFNVVAKNLPIKVLYFARFEKRPKANAKYLIEGSLKKQSSSSFLIKADKKTPWHFVRNNSSLVEVRLLLKRKVKKYIDQTIYDPLVNHFLKGIITGEFDEKILSCELARFGLTHIMAISGLHFGILVSLFYRFFQMFFFPRTAHKCLLFFVVLYFFFLGPSPSIVRAFFSIVVVIIGKLLYRQSQPLNTLGLALLVMVICNPFSLFHVGLQLSFLITTSILFFYHTSERLFTNIWPERNKEKLLQMDRIDRYGYFFLFWVKKALALSLAVNLAAFPLSLFYFHKFSITGTVYNLFFPFFVAVALFLFVGGVIVHGFLPFGAMIVHQINTLWIKVCLDFVIQMPLSIDFHLTFNRLNTSWMILYFTFLFVGGVLVLKKGEEDNFLVI